MEKKIVGWRILPINCSEINPLPKNICEPQYLLDNEGSIARQPIPRYGFLMRYLVE
jgi:hypothetical protein